MENEKKRGRRDWVKNAVILFLALMLVLMFFSNTIMNRSLPEVAAQYPQSGAVTTRIRGSGTVEAAKTYNVSVQSIRTVASVDVKAGDHVEAGDTLMTLDGAESPELTQARETLEALELEYSKLSVPKGDQTHAAWEAWYQAKDAVTRAEEDLAAARAYESGLTSCQDAVTTAQGSLRYWTREKETADGLVTSLTSQIAMVESSNAAYLSAKQRVELYPEDAAAKEELQRIYDEEIAPQVAELNRQLLEAQQASDDAAVQVSYAQTALEDANSTLTQFQTDNAGAMSVDAAETALQSAKDALSTMEASNYDAYAQMQYDDALAEIDLEAKAREVEDARALVEDLEAKTGAAKVVSRYAGTVQTVNVTAGEKTDPETPVAVLELTDQGYTLTATVTRQQARTLHEGMKAEITNLWNSDLTMTLRSITTDKNDPSNNRILTFSVLGEDVTMGQQLSFSVGDKDQSFDVVIPSAAVHTDADGTFVYTVAVKQSSLGNRYTVKKTPVEVLASDDTRSAVSGELSTADFVIVTATVPLQPGDRVRIAE